MISTTADRHTILPALAAGALTADRLREMLGGVDPLPALFRLAADGHVECRTARRCVHWTTQVQLALRCDL